MAYFHSSNTTLKGWHPGEQYVQDRLGFTEASRDSWSHIANFMPDQHRMFHSTRLHFLPIATECPQTGRVWSTILFPALGDVKLDVTSPTPQELIIRAARVAGDPAVESLVNGGELIAGVGIEMSTRRRNKFAGRVRSFQQDSRAMTIHVDVLEAIGNCPKYINVRSFVPHASDPVAQSYADLGPTDALPPSFVDFVHRSDTVFIATAFHPAPPSDHLPHLGSNHRGGLPGFCRVSSGPSSRSVVHVPDYSGNRLMTSLGNIASTPSAGLAFPDFDRGEVLYLTGEADLLFGDEAEAVMPRVRCLSRLTVTGAVLVRDAMPFRADEGVEPSPYTPPVRHLASEPQIASVKTFGAGQEVSLVGVEMLPSHGQPAEAATLARFDFEAEREVDWKAGQYAILDLTSLVGKVAYQHMTWDGDERRINDDGIRTWTISSAPTTHGRTFSITMREIEGGRITSMLFKLARALTLRSISARGLGITLSVRGIGGDFVLPPPSSGKLLFIAGGIGITPTLAMLGSLSSLARADDDVEIWLACKPDELPTFRRLISRSLGPSPSLPLRLRVFTPSPPSSEAAGIETISYDGRLTPATVAKDREALAKVVDGRTVFLCGPLPFEESAVQALKSLGVEPAQIKRESFEF